MLRFFLVAWVLLFFARAASAEPLRAVIHPMGEERPKGPPRALPAWSNRSFFVDGHISIGGPFGLLRAAYSVAPNCCVALEVGGGGSVQGPQLGAMGHVRLPLSAWLALGAEEGLRAVGEPSVRRHRARVRLLNARARSCAPFFFCLTALPRHIARSSRTVLRSTIAGTPRRLHALSIPLQHFERLGRENAADGGGRAHEFA